MSDSVFDELPGELMIWVLIVSELLVFGAGAGGLHGGAADGIAVLALVGARCAPRAVEAGAAFWHMVDLVWVILFPILYLLR